MAEPWKCTPEKGAGSCVQGKTEPATEQTWAFARPWPWETKGEACGKEGLASLPFL